MRFPLERALDALERGGCRVDRATQVARLPEDVVRAALQAAPAGAAPRRPRPALRPRPRRHACHLSNDGCGVRVIDPETGELRPSTKADVADSARFVDAVPQVSFYWGPVVTAEDVPLATRPLHELEAVFANTSKHFQAVDVVGEDMTRRAVEMARVVAGGAEELRRRPIMSLIACPIDPLSNEAVSLEAALVCAEAGVPVGFLSLTLACASAPATMAGNLVVNLAAVLAGIVLLQLAHPGAPVFLAGAPSVMDLKTGGYTGGSPEDYVLAAAATQMAHHFGFAMNMGTMASGAKEPGWQAAVDDALSTLASVSRRRRDDERLRPARRLEDPELRAPAHGDRDLRHRAEGRRRHRGRRRDTGARRDPARSGRTAPTWRRSTPGRTWVRSGVRASGTGRRTTPGWPPARRARSRTRRSRRVRSCGRTRPTRSPRTCAPSSGGSSRRPTPSSRGLAGQRTSARASRSSSVCRSTSAAVVCGAMSAMLWNGVIRMPRLSMNRCR